MDHLLGEFFGHLWLLITRHSNLNWNFFGVSLWKELRENICKRKAARKVTGQTSVAHLNRTNQIAVEPVGNSSRLPIGAERRHFYIF